MLLTILSTTATATDYPVHHSHCYRLYCPPQPLVLSVQTPNTLFLAILSFSDAGTFCADPIYTSSDKTVHQSHYNYIYELQLHIYWQYCQPQPLVLLLLIPLIFITRTLSSKATSTSWAGTTYTSIDNNVRHSHWYHMYWCNLHFYWQYCPPSTTVPGTVCTYTPHTRLLIIMSTTHLIAAVLTQSSLQLTTLYWLY